MFIETESTPNPATLKFLPGRAVMGAGSADFASREGAQDSPLAMSLFGIEGVTRVFLGADFVTVSKSEDSDWSRLKPQLLGLIADHFAAGLPVMLGQAAAADEDVADEDREIVDQI